jgi:inosine-uridine nucleoside N-ribohydrolase
MHKDIVAFVDAPDPDNFVMLIALAKLNPEARVHVVLTGRPVKFGADRSHQLWEWDVESSRMAQQASALRIKNFLKHFGLKVVQVFDGGIAPRTLVPHWIHFEEYYRFLDVDPLAAIRHSELDPQEDLIKLLLGLDSFPVVVGGPMTGLAQVITRHPAVAEKISEVHAMYATWGNVELMDMGGPPRGAKQFNVACDPMAAYQILYGLPCPIYLMPTEVTRVADIGFQNTQELRRALPSGKGADALMHLYALWYQAAVLPRQAKNPDELIFIHDLVGTLSLDPDLREWIYDVVPIEVTSVPIHPYEGVTDAERAKFAADGKPVPSDLHWGDVLMRKTDKTTNIFAATGLTPEGARVYLETLKQIMN